MYYDKQPQKQREEYKRILEVLGKLSRLFSENNTPLLQSRAQENAFARCFEAKNISRADCSADAKKDKLGIGIKTWMGQDNQKVAEFGRKRAELEGLSDLEIVKKIAEYRNVRIEFAKRAYGLNQMIYHIVKRVPGSMIIYEHAFDVIDEKNISLLRRGGRNTIYFTDGKHTYNFNKSKTTLYMLFENLEYCDKIDVKIMQDPFDFLADALTNSEEIFSQKEEIDDIIGKDSLDANQICLRLYNLRNGRKSVPERSGLNQWNARGRQRDLNEIYIAYPQKDRKRRLNFFPNRDTCFALHLPSGETIKAKVCQQDSKAIMSNPNKALGKWLLRDILQVEENTLLTYEMLENVGIDSVIFTKNDELDYSIDFARIGTYERLYMNK